MLYPQSNAFRQQTDLSGFWDFRADPDHSGHKEGWDGGFTGGRPIAVPASWNDQFEEGRDYLGPAWYQTRFTLPWGWEKQQVKLRFASVNYVAEVWLNGQRLGMHEGGHLPFEFDVTNGLRAEDNLLVVRVEGELAPDRVPPGNVPAGAGPWFSSYPRAHFDFFPFCGIQRPVILYAVPRGGLADVTVTTAISGASGIVAVRAACTVGTAVQLSLAGHSAQATAQAVVHNGEADATMTIPDAHLWAPGSPDLYDLAVELLDGATTIDRYTLKVGIRTIEVKGDALLLNGKPILLKGFGRHEDFPIAGRGIVPAVIIKDYALMSWVGANSFRTTHYPYSEQMMDMADRLGFLVIDETPAVGLFFAEPGLERRLELCRQFTQDMIARDKNHPSVIMWSLANEPQSRLPAAKPFFRNLYDLAKSLDDTRPVTVVNMGGVVEEAFEFVDIICVNRYYGWYTNSGELDAGFRNLSGELDNLHGQYAKPFIVAEFGADCMAGMHAQPPEMFTEEYQADVIMGTLDVLKSKSYVVGYHVWNLCDFKTGQGVIRVGGLNLKGVFTRDRRPKLAAHRLREAWARKSPKQRGK
jgi:beta-glucuronidase